MRYEQGIIEEVYVWEAIDKGLEALGRLEPVIETNGPETRPREALRNEKPR